MPSKVDGEAVKALAALDGMVPEQPVQEIGKGKAGPGRGKKTGGPIDLKEPGSEEWTIQMTAHAVRIWMSLNDDTKAWREAVAKLDEQKVWTRYPKEKPYGTRDAFYRAEMGAPEPELTLLKEVQQLPEERR